MIKNNKKPRFLSAENLNCCRIGEETYVFTVDGYSDYCLLVHDGFDFSSIDTDSLNEMEDQMYYNGDMECTCQDEKTGKGWCQRQAKFSETRKRIKEEINRREASRSIPANTARKISTAPQSQPTTMNVVKGSLSII